MPYLDSFGHFRDLAYREIITPDHQHALAGILTYLARLCLHNPHPDVCKVIHGLVAVAGAVALLVIVRRGRETGDWRVEYAAVGVLTVPAPPHLHTYDVVVLLVPIVLLLNLAARSQAA